MKEQGIVTDKGIACEVCGANTGLTQADLDKGYLPVCSEECSDKHSKNQ